MTTNTAALKRDGVRANNRPSLSDENFKRIVTAAIRESRTNIRRNGGDTYDVVEWLNAYLRSQNVTSKRVSGTLVLPSERFVMDHYWVVAQGFIIDPSVEQYRHELGYDVGYFSADEEIAGRYFEQKHDSEEDERRSVKTRLEKLHRLRRQSASQRGGDFPA